MNPRTEGPLAASISRPSRLTVAICTRNRAASLRRTLVSLAAVAPPDAPWEVVLVLNDCSDDSPAVAGEFTGRVPLVVGVEPQEGLARARNAAVALATGDVVVWIDDDVVLPVDWLRNWAAAIQAHPEAAFFGGPINPVFEGAPPPWLIPALPVIGSAFARMVVETDGALVTRHVLPYGANFAMRTSAHRAHPFDVATGLAGVGWIRNGEETRIIEAVMADGGTGVWVKNTRVDHIIAPDRQTLDYVARYYEGFGRLTAPRATTPAARLAVWGDKTVAAWKLRRAAASGDPVRWLLALQRDAIRRGRWIELTERRRQARSARGATSRS